MLGIEMASIKSIVLCLILLLAISACGIPLTSSQIEGTAEAALLKKVHDALKNRDLVAAKGFFNPLVFAKPESEAAFPAMAELVPQQQPQSVEFLTWVVNQSSTDGRSAQVVAQYKYSDTDWLTVTAAFSGEGTTLRVDSYYLNRGSTSYQNTEWLSFANAGAAQLIFFAFVMGALLISLATCILCFTTPGLRRKWLWAIASFIGVATFTMNWSTGELSFTPIYVGIPTANYTQDATGVWYLTFLVPVGAIVFLIKRRQLVSKAAAPPPTG
jgi:hypothetical protein